MSNKRASMTMSKEQQEKIRAEKFIYSGFSKKHNLSDIEYLLLCSDLMKRSINAKQEMKNT